VPFFVRRRRIPFHIRRSPPFSGSCAIRLLPAACPRFDAATHGYPRALVVSIHLTPLPRLLYCSANTRHRLLLLTPARTHDCRVSIRCTVWRCRAWLWRTRPCRCRRLYLAATRPPLPLLADTATLPSFAVLPHTLTTHNACAPSFFRHTGTDVELRHLSQRRAAWRRVVTRMKMNPVIPAASNLCN